MDAVQDHRTRYLSRVPTRLVAVIAAALLAGGTGGYVIRAATSSWAPAIAVPVPAHNVTSLPFREHRDPSSIGPQIGHSLEHLDG